MKKIFISSFLLIVPVFVSAQDLSRIRSLVVSVGDIVGIAAPVAFALALLFFFWGLARFVLVAGDSTSKEQGKNIMIWGVTALFVSASVWGLVRFLQENLGITNNSNISIPGFGRQTGSTNRTSSSADIDTYDTYDAWSDYGNVIEGDDGSMVNVNDEGYSADGQFYGQEYEGDTSAAYQPPVESEPEVEINYDEDAMNAESDMQQMNDANDANDANSTTPMMDTEDSLPGSGPAIMTY